MPSPSPSPSPSGPLFTTVPLVGESRVVAVWVGASPCGCYATASLCRYPSAHTPQVPRATLTLSFSHPLKRLINMFLVEALRLREQFVVVAIPVKKHGGMRRILTRSISRMTVTVVTQCTWSTRENVHRLLVLCRTITSPSAILECCSPLTQPRSSETDTDPYSK